MTIKQLKHELQNVLSGKSQVSHGNFIQTIARYLGTGTSTSPMAQGSKHGKREETEKLTAYIQQKNLWVKSINFNDFVSVGAEQQVFIKNEQFVYKLNDTIYYASWVDYLQNLLLNNFFFPDTAYQLLGFCKRESVLYAVVEERVFRQ